MPIDSISDDVKKLHTEMEASAVQAAKLGKSLETLVETLGIRIGPILKIFGLHENLAKSAMRRQTELNLIQDRATAELMKQKTLVEDLAEIKKDLAAYEMAGDARNIRAATVRLSALERERFETDQLIVSLKRESGELENIGGTTRALIKTVLGGAAEAAALVMIKRIVTEWFNFNKALIGANSELRIRNKLFDTVLVAQTRTGAFTKEISEAAENLRQNGLLYREDLERNLVIVEKLRLGLGLSSVEGARLANQARILVTNLADVGDALANIQDHLTLTVGQIGQLSDSVYDVVRGIGREGTFNKAILQAAALEDSLRKVGASAGSAVEIIRSFSDLQGGKGGLAMAMGAMPGMGLGAGQDQFTAFVERVGRRLEGPLESMRRNPGNWGALIQFQAMAQQFGLTTRRATELAEASKLLRKTQEDLSTTTKTFTERWLEQSAHTGAVWGQLMNNIRGLIEIGIRPLTLAVAALNEAVSFARQNMPDWAKSAAEWVIELGAVAGAIGFVIKAFSILAGAGRVIAQVFAIARGGALTAAAASAAPSLVVGGAVPAGTMGSAAATGGVAVAVNQAARTGVLSGFTRGASTLTSGLRSVFSWLLRGLFSVGGAWAIGIAAAAAAVYYTSQKWADGYKKDLEETYARFSKKNYTDLSNKMLTRDIGVLSNDRLSPQEQISQLNEMLKVRSREFELKADQGEDVKDFVRDYGQELSRVMQERISQQVVKINSDVRLGEDAETRQRDLRGLDDLLIAVNQTNAHMEELVGTVIRHRAQAVSIQSAAAAKDRSESLMGKLDDLIKAPMPTIRRILPLGF